MNVRESIHSISTLLLSTHSDKRAERGEIRFHYLVFPVGKMNQYWGKFEAKGWNGSRERGSEDGD